jgi:hypothetical protein
MGRSAYSTFTCECGVACVMVPHETSGKLAPITVAKHDGGNIETVQATDNGPRYTYRVPKAEREQYPEPRHLSHWTDCTAAGFQRRSGRS